MDHVDHYFRQVDAQGSPAVPEGIRAACYRIGGRTRWHGWRCWHPVDCAEAEDGRHSAVSPPGGNPDPAHAHDLRYVVCLPGVVLSAGCALHSPMVYQCGCHDAGCHRFYHWRCSSGPERGCRSCGGCPVLGCGEVDDLPILCWSCRVPRRLSWYWRWYCHGSASARAGHGAGSESGHHGNVCLPELHVGYHSVSSAWCPHAAVRVVVHILGHCCHLLGADID
mmetsp:Transcript_44145/g.96023  ORF Transcript_44145/g.96023 Transcript_44145/m.96023 type:complete len:223 (-) Transcript_44145:373-1041(-)